MYTAENYHWGLVGYYLGCLLLMSFFYRYRSLIPGRHFRHLVLLLIATVLFVPVTAYLDSSFLAPAWFVSIFESMTEPMEQAYLRGLQPIIVCYIALAVIYLLWAIFGGGKSKKVKNPPEDSAEPTEQ